MTETINLKHNMFSFKLTISLLVAVSATCAANRLAIGSWRSIKIWNLDSELEDVRTLTEGPLDGHYEDIKSLKLIDNNTLASCSEDTTVKIWDLKSGKCLRTLKGHSNGALSLQLVGENKLASGADQSIIIWDLQSGQNIRALKGHLGGVWSLQLLANGHLSSGSGDASIKIW